MTTSLAQRIEKAYIQHRIWIDQQAESFPTVNCWCSASLDLDYSQGDREMTNRLSKFLSEHEKCQPREDV